MAAYGLLARAIGTRVLLPALRKGRDAEKFVSRQVGRVFSRARQTKKGAFVRPGKKGFIPKKSIEKRGRTVIGVGTTAPLAKDAYSAIKSRSRKSKPSSVSSPTPRTVLSNPLASNQKTYYKAKNK
tara:strand:- start:4589 stop:4966 length:378 start_codon:yes stop_codon:yes gene_type:complete